MTKPTGRPKGAPRKYDSDEEKPRTYSLRVPRTLDAPLQRYARAHRQSVSELFLDGIRWRLTEGDPYGDGLVLPPVGVETEKPYYENTDEGNMLVRELQALRTLLTEAVASGAVVAYPSQSRNTGIHESGVAAVEPRASGACAASPAPAVLADRNVPAFDTTKNRLGKLCPRMHDYHGTGQSLLRLPQEHCRQCENEHKRERRQRQKAAKSR